MNEQLRSLLESGALFAGESLEAFHEFRDRIIGALGGPLDFIDLILIDEIVDYSWESIRLRKLKAAYLQRHIAGKIYEVLTKVRRLSGEDALNMMKIDGNAKFERIGDIDSSLQSAGFTRALLEADVVMEMAPRLKEFERMIAAAEERRDYHLREVERHRHRPPVSRDQVVDLDNSDFVPTDKREITGKRPSRHAFAQTGAMRRAVQDHVLTPASDGLPETRCNMGWPWQPLIPLRPCLRSAPSPISLRQTVPTLS